jgi:AmmeMemoRadiSam system protein B
LNQPAFAIISPHGSLNYSGRIAARAWGALLGAAPSLIIIAGSAHSPYEEGIFFPESTYFVIPGATLSVDTALQEYLFQKVENLKMNDLPHLEDHSIEMQLLFASHFFPGIPILPFIISGCSKTTIETALKLMKAIVPLMDQSAVLVISSDFAVSNTPEECDALSRKFIDSLVASECTHLDDSHSMTHSFCGETAIRSFMRAHPTLYPIVLDYVNSGVLRQHADELVVGYAALYFARSHDEFFYTRE